MWDLERLQASWLMKARRDRDSLYDSNCQVSALTYGSVIANLHPLPYAQVASGLRHLASVRQALVEAEEGLAASSDLLREKEAEVTFSRPVMPP